MQDGWKKIENPDDEFAFDLPSGFNLDETEDENDTARSYSYSGGGVRLFVFSDPVKDCERFDVILNFLAARERKTKTYNDLSGDSYNFGDDEGFFHSVFTIKSETRTYVFHGVATENQHKDVTRFIRSISLNSKSSNLEFPRNADNRIDAPVPQSSPTPPIKSSNPELPPKVALSTPAGTGRSGSDEGLIHVPVPQLTPAPSTKPLKIVSKPRPAYTDIARIYSIQGTVILRVVFRSDGTMGEITVLKALPFGLTNSAKTALSKMRFKPETRDGKPYAVSKNVEYTFTIF